MPLDLPTPPPRSSVLHWAIGTLGILGIGALDYLSGIEMRVFPLYYLPLAILAWSAGRTGAAVATLLCGGTWLASNLLAGREYSLAVTWYVNTGMQALSFATVGLLIAEGARLLPPRAGARPDRFAHGAGEPERLLRRGGAAHGALPTLRKADHRRIHRSGLLGAEVLRERGELRLRQGRAEEAQDHREDARRGFRSAGAHLDADRMTAQLRALLDGIRRTEWSTPLGAPGHAPTRRTSPTRPRR